MIFRRLRAIVLCMAFETRWKRYGGVHPGLAHAIDPQHIEGCMGIFEQPRLITFSATC